jgi:DNA-binding transcriptional LysR family regulator
MELRQLRYFVAVAQELHFTRAAHLLHVVQPALSRQIRLLEDEVGTRLFDRTNRSVRLTPAGHAFRPRAQFALEQAAKAASDAARVGRGEAGSISIGFVSTAVYSVLPNLLRWFQQQIPAVHVELHELEPSEQLAAIERGSLDVGVMHVLLENPELESVIVSREPLVVALSKGHAVNARKRVDLRRLARKTILLPPRHSLVGFHDLVVSAFQRVGLVPSSVQSVRLLETAVGLVAGGVGVALVPRCFQDHLRIRGVVYRPLTGVKTEAELLAVWRKDNSSPLLARLQKHLRTLMGADGRSQPA